MAKLSSDFAVEDPCGLQLMMDSPTKIDKQSFELSAIGLPLQVDDVDYSPLGPDDGVPPDLGVLPAPVLGFPTPGEGALNPDSPPPLSLNRLTILITLLTMSGIIFIRSRKKLSSSPDFDATFPPSPVPLPFVLAGDLVDLGAVLGEDFFGVLPDDVLESPSVLVLLFLGSASFSVLLPLPSAADVVASAAVKCAGDKIITLDTRNGKILLFNIKPPLNSAGSKYYRIGNFIAKL